VLYTNEEYLSCGVTTWFWVSWFNGLVLFGEGSTPGNDYIMIFEDDNPIVVNYAAISSKSNNTVQWTIPDLYSDAC